ncbi:hypothetical protein EIL87_03095 [Saccharopolyspora rhizosphaerae]|uniref:Uncharacterized protein n=1 Tax=Saccharopolyspora rhizosphaerae TaxID=2492662 RepID=A0A426K389_9PSEU|nr:hypothetical protein [Saccharopolyspora rhizosphaerae]RRO19977.1 hypothetical protein EIL87_03095 [Saccharopolyspora rhizosphaerae]
MRSPERRRRWRVAGSTGMGAAGAPGGSGSLGLMVPRLRLLTGVVVEVSLLRLRRTLERARPPDPSPRRLAARGVLRR